MGVVLPRHAAALRGHDVRRGVPAATAAPPVARSTAVGTDRDGYRDRAEESPGTTRLPAGRIVPGADRRDRPGPAPDRESDSRREDRGPHRRTRDPVRSLPDRRAGTTGSAHSDGVVLPRCGFYRSRVALVREQAAHPAARRRAGLPRPRLRAAARAGRRLGRVRRRRDRGGRCARPRTGDRRGPLARRHGPAARRGGGPAAGGVPVPRRGAGPLLHPAAAVAARAGRAARLRRLRPGRRTGRRRAPSCPPAGTGRCPTSTTSAPWSGPTSSPTCSTRCSPRTRNGPLDGPQWTTRGATTRRATTHGTTGRRTTGQGTPKWRGGTRCRRATGRAVDRRVSSR